MAFRLNDSTKANKWTPEGEPEPCHRCGTLEGVEEKFVVTNWAPALAGVQPKATGYFTYGCPPCLAEFADMVLEKTGWGIGK